MIRGPQSPSLSLAPAAGRLSGDSATIARVADLTVLLADDQVATRIGVRRVLEAHGLRVVAEAANAAEAVEAALIHRPVVCLLAVRMPGNGIAAAEQITSALPDTKIVMLTASSRDEDLFGALRAGAVGYLLKSTSAERLPYAIRGVLQGEAALPRELTAHLLQEFRAGGRRRNLPLAATGSGVELTAREFEVLQLFRQRKRTAEIAAALHISEVTVRRHISAIVHKLEVPDRKSALELLEREENQQPEAL